MNNVRRLRKEQWLSQAQLARKAGVSLRTISSVETKNTTPRNTTKRKIMNALGFNFKKQDDREAVFPLRMQ